MGMPRGGARIRSGPPPDPSALRRERKDDGGWVTLPREGRDGPAPSWPLSRATKREEELWAAEWARPQAVVWEENGQELEVAMFVRSVRLAEVPSAPTNARTLVRQQMDSLGISIPGMQRLKWRIGEAPVRAEREATDEPSAKERLKLVQGGA